MRLTCSGSKEFSSSTRQLAYSNSFHASTNIGYFPRLYRRLSQKIRTTEAMIIPTTIISEIAIDRPPSRFELSNRGIKIQNADELPSRGNTPNTDRPVRTV